MKKFELKITPLDWILIITVAILFSSSIAIIIYKTLNADWQDGLLVGSVLGFCLAIFSILFVTLNNLYILPKISKPYVWWIFSAIFSSLAGYIGFYSAFFLVKIFIIPIPENILNNINTLAVFSAFLNYLTGLLIYLFVNMKTKKQELESLLAESRILSLNIQLNSHFLQNVLNSIAELIRIDSEKAEEALIKLSRFLRKVLKEQDIIPISEEVENVKGYVELENLRYGGLIKLKIISSDKAQNILIPRFSIQLLVENAIKHGFTGSELNIEIIFDISNSLCQIKISNDGKPVKDLRFGTGLKNLSKRLKILCNGKLELGDRKKNEFLIKIPI